ncbi:MAG: EGF domain-containing protein [Sandaracinaceae bacterium]
MRHTLRFAPAAVVAVALLVTASPAFAFPEYVNSRYGRPALPGTVTYSCNDCHVDPSNGGNCNASGASDPWSPCFNPFGIRYRNVGWSASLGNEDTDGDGVNNLTELNGASSAGFPTEAEADCDMLMCAQNEGSPTDCAGRVLCNASRITGDPTAEGSSGVPPENANAYSYSFSFTCEPGTGNPPTPADTNWGDNCTDINECAGNPCGVGICSQRPLSGWTAPGYDCNCAGNPGYFDNGVTCQLVNACQAGTDNCVAESTCIDTAGSSAVFTCACDPGYAGDGMSTGTGCTDIDECATDPCGPNDDGAGPDGNGCIERPIGTWTLPGYDCTCATGYGTNGTTCVVADECTAGLDTCVLGATCLDPTSAIGDFICTCPSGFVGDGESPGTGCTDVDECAMSIDNCDTNATCTNTPGSFMCACNGPEWVGTGVVCNDYDECMDPIFSSNCDANATCNNLVPSFECVCDAGFTGDGGTCTDIDECAAGTDDCSADATCTNNPGSFSCDCDTGYVGDGVTCTDVDECMDTAFTSLCSTAATCNNLVGDWECVCNTGFRGDGRMCDDIDECTEGTDVCDGDATCINDPGSYSCECNEGYQGSGFTCADVDECALGTGGCGVNEVCVNNLGTPNDCICAPGFARVDPADPMSACQVNCGDGARATGEECDDGNLDGGDGCDAGCGIESGWACFEPTGEASVCENTCGDGLVQTAEECDDGTSNSDSAADACRTTCRLPSCGDGTTDTGEGCDDGDANSDSATDGCRTDCSVAYCGDGVVDTGELCDPGGGVPSASVVGTCTTLCSPDAGLDPADPPVLTGGACRAVPNGGSPLPLLLLGALGAVFFIRRRS